MSTALTKVEPQVLAPKPDFTGDQIDLIKRTVARGTTDDELALFLYTARKRGLDPLVKQIYAIKRRSKNGDVMSIQTGIDGYRAVADRTQRYAPGQETKIVYDSSINDQYNPKKIVSATAYVRKLVGKTWHEVGATAYWDEYRPLNYDYNNKTYTLADMWKRMPHTMIGKCAEALALRKAFPEDLSGLYTFEEMQQADTFHPPHQTEQESIAEYESKFADVIDKAEGKEPAKVPEKVEEKWINISGKVDKILEDKAGLIWLDLNGVVTYGNPALLPELRKVQIGYEVDLFCDSLATGKKKKAYEIRAVNLVLEPTAPPTIAAESEKVPF